jgi:hypothetical protein
VSNITIFETDLQNKIAELYLNGKEQKEIASICACSLQHVSEVVNSAKFMQISYDKAMQKLLSEGVRVAIDTLIEVAKDKKAPKQARVSASDKLMTHTGYHVNDQGRLEKAPANMTQSELNARVQELMNEQAKRAKPIITIEAETEKPSNKLADILE